MSEGVLVWYFTVVAVYIGDFVWLFRSGSKYISLIPGDLEGLWLLCIVDHTF